jgi:hypothetical protein
MVGYINIIEKNNCKHKECNCGWNLFIGGTDLDDLKLILKAIKKHNELWSHLIAEED